MRAKMRGMGKYTNIKAADGHELQAWLAMPMGMPLGGLVVIQEAFGLSSYVRSVCESFATDGYAVIAPALYDRQERGAAFDGHDPEVIAQGRKLRGGLVWKDVLADVAAAIEGVSYAGKVGIVGYCVGGSVAWLAAQSLPVTAAVGYYGRDIVDHLEPAPKCPVMLHFGERDHLIPLADVERIRAAYPAIPNHVYPVAHGFDGLRAPGDEPAAKLARSRTLELFRKYVG